MPSRAAYLFLLGVPLFAFVGHAKKTVRVQVLHRTLLSIYRILFGYLRVPGHVSILFQHCTFLLNNPQSSISSIVIVMPNRARWNSEGIHFGYGAGKIMLKRNRIDGSDPG
jgi:hypothetical protein